jgi:two-component system, cell cycle response regulator DivK
MSQNRKTVLLVEDNETIRDAFGILLEDSGYGVLQAATGAAALAAAQDSSPDLILLDLGLPDMPGLEVTRRLKADGATSTIPVVAITGRALETDRDACLAAGCDGYLTKPVDTRQLLRQVAEFVAR